jgi:hypothetical protein
LFDYSLADAAPIKVLLFRKVTRIQTLLLRHAPRERLEDGIKDALYVYRYWNAVYGPFILDCIASHDLLPARIQSWYICLTGHWHLAVLLLADIIQTIDDQLGLESHYGGGTSRLITGLRQRSTQAVADLARCSCPREDASFLDAGYHFAMNQGAILTEPWTQVLIRVFTKAGALLLADATISEFRTDRVRKEALQRSDDCIEALWYLGRKSDMAFLAAKILTRALKASTEGMATSNEYQGSEDWYDPGFSLDSDLYLSAPSSESDDSLQRMRNFEYESLEDTAAKFPSDHAGIVPEFDGFDVFP